MGESMSDTPATPVPNVPSAPAFYQPGRSYDEMLTRDGDVRSHYATLQSRMSSLTGAELADRQRTLERSFLLQGITFTVYGADSATERIIPTDLFPRVIPAENPGRWRGAA
jgi:uncharacterized circularly permuted ATP-grasp superfamily protein